MDRSSHRVRCVESPYSEQENLSCCPDPIPRIRLIAATPSGAASIYTLSRSKSGTFTVPDSPAPVSVDAASHPLPSGSFVIDAKTAARMAADRQGLSAVIEASSGKDVGRRVVWVSAGTKGARCVADLDGDNLGTSSWPSKAGAVVAVDIVEKNGMSKPSHELLSD